MRKAHQQPLSARGLPVGVCVTHDRHGNDLVFGYIGGHRRQKARRFNPRKLGSVEVAVEAAQAWRRKMERSLVR